MPSSILMNYKDGVYAIDSDSDIPGASEKNVLTWMVSFLFLVLLYGITTAIFSAMAGNSPREVLDYTSR